MGWATFFSQTHLVTLHTRRKKFTTGKRKPQKNEIVERPIVSNLKDNVVGSSGLENRVDSWYIFSYKNS
jgi:hypothetical protein